MVGDYPQKSCGTLGKGSQKSFCMKMIELALTEELFTTERL